ncbi:MAG: hypothetical protein C4547_00280 [Phycisphaerales bacterium]|nr:MAG: hypothetical protein C4547_00280 [Phycisphaerales bacterium]
MFGRKPLCIALCMAAVGAAAGCISLPDNVLPVGTPFVLSGTTAVLNRGGPCPVWEGENGVTYHLFQGIQLDNESFDRITRPGVTSRLVIATRSDLVLECRVGTIVEVRDVLEIVE